MQSDGGREIFLRLATTRDTRQAALDYATAVEREKHDKLQDRLAQQAKAKGEGFQRAKFDPNDYSVSKIAGTLLSVQAAGFEDAWTLFRAKCLESAAEGDKERAAARRLYRRLWGWMRSRFVQKAATPHEAAE